MTEPEYPEGETPTLKPTERAAFDPHEEWGNYWDVNPIEHGGRFVRWLPGREQWQVIEVTPPSAWPEPEHIIERFWFEPSDVWADPGDPETGFTDAMESILESLGDENHLPNADPFLENVTYYVGDLIHHTHAHSGATTVEIDGPEEYWSEVGIDPEDVEGVSDDDLPN